MGGATGQLGIKSESVWGVPVTVDKFVPFLSETMELQRATLESQAILANRLTAVKLRPGGRGAAGGFEVELLNTTTATLLKHAFGTVVTTGAGPYCVDEKTEILTVDGWRRYDEIGPGTIVRTLNHETGLAEWQPIESVHVFPAEDRELVSIETRDHSSLTTTNHRWPVESFRHRQGRFVRAWKTSETLAMADRIIKAAPSADQPIEQKWSDDLVELVAWFYTEGTVRESGAITLCQSHEVNSDLCVRIEGVLRRMFGDPTDFMRGRLRVDQPRWALSTDSRNMRYRLNKAASDLLLVVAPDKVPSFEWLRELTIAQLHLFVNVSLLADGDGGFGEVRTPRMGQTDRRRAEAFQYAVVLLGFGTSMRWREQEIHAGQHVVSIHSGTRSSVLATSRVAVSKGLSARVTRVRHDGIVWCPKTPNATWLARRNGSVYFTGNTHTYTPGSLAGDSFTLQIGKPDINDTVYPFTYPGSKIASWDINVAVDEFAKMAVNVSSKSEAAYRVVTDGVTTNTSTAVTSATAAFAAGDVGLPISGAGIPANTTIASVQSATAATLSAAATATATGVTFTIGVALASASYDSALSPFTWTEASVTVGGSSACIKSLTLSGDNNLKTDRRCLGGPFIHDQAALGKRTYGGTMVADFDGLTQYRRFANATEAAVVVAFNNGSQSLTLTANVEFTGETPKISSASDILEQPMPFTVLSSTSDAAALTAVLINSEASAA